MTTETLANSSLELHETFNAGTSRTSLVIEASRSRTGINWREIWRYRELLYFLTWRDVKIRYKQTVMGGAWAILQPVMTMIVFSIFFGHLAGLGKQTDGIPYPIWSFAGVLPWTFFANSIANSGNSLVSSSSLITKVYFPRLVIPLAAVGAGLVDLAIAFVVLIGLMFYYHVAVTWQLVLVPVFLFGTIMTATGIGTLLSALIVAYRDFRYVVPFMIQLWMFISPVTYPSKMVPDKWRWVLALNPMSGLIDGFRSAFLGRAFDWPHIGVSMLVSTLLFFIGAAYFRKVERRFADII